MDVTRNAHRPKLLCIGKTKFCSFDVDAVRKFGRNNERNVVDLLFTLFGREPRRGPIVTLLDLREQQHQKSVSLLRVRILKVFDRFALEAHYLRTLYHPR